MIPLHVTVSALAGTGLWLYHRIMPANLYCSPRTFVSAGAVFVSLVTISGCVSRGGSTGNATGLPSAQTAGGPASADVLLNPDHPEWSRQAPPRSHLRFETSKGVFVLELNREWGPIGADRLYNLVRLGYFNDTRFHRVNRNYIVQWGLHGNPAANAAWKDRYMRDDPPRSTNTRGTYAFSYKGPGQANTRNTQIYINLGDNSRNNVEPFTILGTVVEGMSVLDSLYSGYGETSGSGVRQARQGPLETGGNAFMDREYPLLDRVLRATAITRL